MTSLNLPVYNEKDCMFFSLGRNAIYAACILLGLKPGDEVLTPAFDCDSALEPFRVIGLKMTFYRSNPNDFSVDMEDIKSKIGPQTKLLHVVNHFGMPQPWDDLSALSKSFDVPILEDNAYSLFSSYKGRPFGTLGDMAVFSLRKNIPIPDGGMLKVNKENYLNSIEQSNARYCYWDTLNILVRAALKKAIGRHLSRKASSLINNVPVPLFSDEKKGYPVVTGRDKIDKLFSSDHLRPISGYSAASLGKFSKKYFEDIKSKKIELYDHVVKNISDIPGLKVLYPVLPEGAVPYCVSMGIDKGRDEILRKLSDRYDIMSWPTLSMDVINRLSEFPEVEFLGRKILQINLSTENVLKNCFKIEVEKLAENLRGVCA